MKKHLLIFLALLLSLNSAALAQEQIPSAAERIHFDGAFMRHDIGRRALAAMEEQ